MLRIVAGPTLCRTHMKPCGQTDVDSIKFAEQFPLGSPPALSLELFKFMSTASTPIRHFASDNYAGICPEAWAALAEANAGHVTGYGDDAWTQKAADRIRDVFETHCEVFFVFNGTSANSLSLASLCQSYHSVLCHELAHVEVAECGAPEFFANGSKLLLVGEARRFGLRVHMDGARFANAVAALNVAPKDFAWKAGVDVLCFGMTKNG